METVKRSAVARVWGGQDKKGTGDVKDNEMTLCDAALVVTCHRTFVQTHWVCNMKSEP